MIKTAILLATEHMSILREEDVVPFRYRVKECAAGIKMGLVNQTYLITAASELARNMLKYADGGIVLIETIERDGETGIRLMFKDQGPGIEDVGLALKDGFSTGGSLGVGLPGAKRLVNEFEIASEPGKGTSVTIIRWANG
ncbi:anti-sigma regulatory factor [Parapedobacter pyrenivorans]|uniref:Anti-sigma regulatory factor n=1 Tax=Parapedobacter pyrenivorans TaxID=1305674 RepID=A0A917I3K9_9SPHI|nr:anti-sigma regulatory factor [Parapedobacter pyrenivorans]GGH04286.1 anti-sigma regulatory factor [Parapedobacter pyrenivorans]